MAQRVALLQGLLDTEGSVGNGTHASFSSTSERLARDVQEIAWSIGAIATIARRQIHFTNKHGKKQAGRPSWRVSIVHSEIARLFSLPRKVALCRRSSVVDRRLRISRIEEIGEKPAQCIKVAHPEGLYVTNDFNVPLNDTLATVDPASADGATQWASYLAAWTNWNHVRTAAALMAAVSFTVAFCFARWMSEA